MKRYVGVLMYGASLFGIGYFYGHKIGKIDGASEAYGNIADDTKHLREQIASILY